MDYQKQSGTRDTRYIDRFKCLSVRAKNSWTLVLSSLLSYVWSEVESMQNAEAYNQQPSRFRHQYYKKIEHFVPQWTRVNHGYN